MTQTGGEGSWDTLQDILERAGWPGVQTVRRDKPLAQTMAQQIVREMEVAAAELQTVIGRVQGRVQDILQQEIQRAVEGALGNIRDSLSNALAPTLPITGPPSPSQDPDPQSETPPTAFAQTWEQLWEPGEAGTSQEPEETAPEAGDSVAEGMYQGAVRLTIEAGAPLQQLARFLDSLWRDPRIRPLRVVGNEREEVDVWVELRQPLDLETMVGEMSMVEEVCAMREPPSTDDDTGVRLHVWLREALES